MDPLITAIWILNVPLGVGVAWMWFTNAREFRIRKQRVMYFVSCLFIGWGVGIAIGASLRLCGVI